MRKIEPQSSFSCALRDYQRLTFSSVKISLNWLKHYVEPRRFRRRTAARDHVSRLRGRGGGQHRRCRRSSTSSWAKSRRATSIPNADKLSVCTVDVGPAGGVHTIVCGAQNYKAGNRVPVALPGAVLPGDFKIKQSKIRGQQSDGMMCARGRTRPGRRSRRPAHPRSGRPRSARRSTTVLPGGDTVFDLEITPNRPDCALPPRHRARTRRLVPARTFNFPQIKFRGAMRDGVSAPIFSRTSASTRRRIARSISAYRHHRREDRPEPGVDAGAAEGRRPAPDQQCRRRGQLRDARDSASRCTPSTRRKSAAARSSSAAPRTAKKSPRSTARSARSTAACSSSPTRHKPVVIAGIMGGENSGVERPRPTSCSRAPISVRNRSAGPRSASVCLRIPPIVSSAASIRTARWRRRSARSI